MKTLLIIILDALFLGLLGFILLFLNTYINNNFISIENKGVGSYIIRFLIINVEAWILLFLLHKTLYKFFKIENLLNWILITNILIIVIISAIFFYYAFQKGI
jgi:hypothetical protein